MKKAAMSFRYGFQLFYKHFFANSLLIFEVIVTVLAINFSISTIQGLYIDLNFIKNANENTLFVMPSGDLTNNEEAYLDYSNIVGEYTVGEQYSVHMETPFETNATFVYNGSLLDNVFIPLSVGAWTSEPIDENGDMYYPVIVNNTQQIAFGERFEARSDKKKVKCYVAGVLDTNQRFVNLNSTSSAASTQQLVRESKNETLIFLNSDHFPLDCFDYRYTSNNKLLFFEEMNDAQKKHNKDVLRKQGFVFELSEIINNSEKGINEKARYYIPLSLGILIVSITGLLSFSLISFHKNKPFFNTVVLFGARKKDCIYISFVNCLLITACSLVVIFFVNVTNQQNEFLSLVNIELSKLNIIVTVLVYLIVLVLGFAAPLGLFKSNSACHKKENIK